MLRIFPDRPPAPPMVSGDNCCCFCHSRGPCASEPFERDETAFAPLRINGIGNRPVPRDDPLWAAQACPVCRDYHCPALSGKPAELLTRRIYDYRPDPSAYTDAPRTEKQADGGA